jgi:hypothetical protein
VNEYGHVNPVFYVNNWFFRDIFLCRRSCDRIQEKKRQLPASVKPGIATQARKVRIKVIR